MQHFVFHWHGSSPHDVILILLFFIVFQKHLTTITDHSKPHVFKITKDAEGKAIIQWKDLTTEKVRASFFKKVEKLSNTLLL